MYVIDFFDKKGNKYPETEQFKTEKEALDYFDKLVTTYVTKGNENVGSLEIYDSETDENIKEWEWKDVESAEETSESLTEDLNVTTEMKSEEIAKFIEELYNLRKNSMVNEGEYGLGNLVFKEFRNMGYLDNLKELRKQEKAKELSLEQLKEQEALEEDYQNSIRERDDAAIKAYRRHAHLEDSDLITEENLNEYALNKVSAYENYDIEDLRNLLLNRGK